MQNGTKTKKKAVTALPASSASSFLQMSESGDIVDVKDVLSCMVEMSRLANEEITRVHNKRLQGGGNEVLQTSYKEEGDARSVVSVADKNAQKIVLAGIRSRFPGLAIVAEEEEEEEEKENEKEEDSMDLDAPPPPPPTSSLPSLPSLRVPLSELVLFVDPLDGTREFVEGRVGNCMCLIGLARRGEPVAGVANAPFSHLAYAMKSAPPVILEPARRPFAGNFSVVREDLSSLRVAISGASCSPIKAIRDTLTELGCTITEVGGAGNKAMRLLTGDFDLVIFNFKTSLWDTAATEALVTAAGGKVTDLFGRKIQHVIPADHPPNFLNKFGVMMTRKGVPHDALSEMFSNMEAVSQVKEFYEPPFCSSALMGEATVNQPTYLCLSCCPPSEGGLNACFCAACIQKCHKDCDVMYVGNVESNCDCKKSGCCKIAEESSDAAAKFLQLTGKPPLCCLAAERGGGSNTDRLDSFDSYRVTSLHPSLKICCEKMVKETKDTHWVGATTCLSECLDEATPFPLENFAARVFKFHFERLKQSGSLPQEIDFERSGAEWWVQVKDLVGDNASTAIDMHYDKDEQLAEDFW